MVFEIVKLPIVPNGDMPTLHFSQADKGRDFGVDIVDLSGDSIDPTPYAFEFHLRKVDDTIVTLDFAYKLNNVTFFRATEQFCACIGQNLGEVVMKDNSSGAILGTLNCFVNVERDPLINGLTSESEIHNLRDQIEDITTEVIGDDYYDKTETDALLANKADVSDLPDMSLYYKKTQIDALLANKANVSDLPDMTDYYTKTATDNLLADKADVEDLPDMSEYYDKTEVDNLLAYKADIEDLPDMSDYYTKDEINEFIITYDTTDPAAVAEFVTDIPHSLKGIEASIMAKQEGVPSPSDVKPIIGFDEINVFVKDGTDVTKSTTNIDLGRTVYGGTLDVISGVLTVKWGLLELGSLNWLYNSGLKRFYARYDAGKPSGMSNGLPAVCEIYPIDLVNGYNYLADDTMSVGSNFFDNNSCAIVVHDESYTDAATFKADITGHYVASELVTQQTYQLTPKQIDTILGTNKISHDGNGNISVKFYESIRKYLDDTRED